MTQHPEPETDEQRADRLETERDHTAGDHTHCGVTCEATYPSDQLRNFILAKGYPGTGGALGELLRRAAIRTDAGQDQPTAPPTDDLPARLRDALTERFTELGNPYSEMRRHEKGPDGWPASHPVGPEAVAEVLRELLASEPATPAGQDQPHDRRALPCSLAVLTRPHPAHDWEPQPGMTPVHCVGAPEADRWATTWIDPARQDGLTAVHAEAIRAMKGQLRAVADTEQQELRAELKESRREASYFAEWADGNGRNLNTALADNARLRAELAQARGAEFELRGTAEIQAATLTEAADALGRMDYDTDSNDYGYDTYRDAWDGGVMDGAGLLRRMAAEAQQDTQPEEPTS